jgi:hypothetical protein
MQFDVLSLPNPAMKKMVRAMRKVGTVVYIM